MINPINTGYLKAGHAQLKQRFGGGGRSEKQHTLFTQAGCDYFKCVRDAGSGH